MDELTIEQAADLPVVEQPADPPKVALETQAACDIAAGRVQADPAAIGASIIGAKKDLNCKGRGPQWYRMVWRAGTWQYVSDERLPAGSFRASERRAEVHGEVFPGEIVVGHDRGGPVDSAWLARERVDGKALVTITFAKRRDGNLAFTLPDGSIVVLSNPRAK